ncbi:MAG: ATP synthase F0 subunit B [Deltaproteobacteria bacterium]|nr:ATP synthase F0 subunit B [Deltaproteobacteria bacterium]
MINFSFIVTETLITINETLVVQLIHFLILLFIMNRLMLQPLLKLISEREEFSRKTKSEIKDIEVKIGQLKEDFVSKENAARQDAARERSEITDVGKTEAEGFLDTSRNEVATVRNKADKEVEDEVSKTQPLVEGQAASLVEGIIEKIIVRRVEA